MKLKFFGGANEVGRNCVLCATDKSRVLLDCGVMLGKEIAYPLITPEEVKDIDAIIVTHAHLDHIGYLPFIVDYGSFKIYCTKPTRDLIPVLLSDFRRINKGRMNFTTKNVEKLLARIKMCDYNQEVKISEDFKFRLKDAGHILGSAMVDINDGKLLYTGDFNTLSNRLLNGCAKDLRAETLIMESTYSGKEDVFESQKEIIKKFADSLKETLEKRGIVIIPSFAVGRAQNILLLIADLMKSKVVPEAPIYLDGMIKKANRIHRQNVIYAKRELQLRILVNEEDPFKSSYFKVSRKKDRSDIQGPAVIVTTSGMITGGPILNYLKNYGTSKNNKIIFVGYQAEGTKGRMLLQGEKILEIDDQKIEIQAEIEYHRFSGHADRQGLTAFIKGIKDLKKIFLIHGEPQKLKEFSKTLKKYEVIIPENNTEYEI